MFDGIQGILIKEVKNVFTAPKIKRAGKRDTRAPYLDKNDSCKTKPGHIPVEATLKGSKDQVLKPFTGAAEHCYKTSANTDCI